MHPITQVGAERAQGHRLMPTMCAARMQPCTGAPIVDTLLYVISLMSLLTRGVYVCMP